ncbi:MAG: hypothetical protein ACI9KE_003118 [Polyangiales bacterium]|jgi:hypothetical protein
MMRPSILLLLLFLLACSEPSQSAQTPTPETPAGEAFALERTTEALIPEAVDPAPNLPPDPCASLRSETNAILVEPIAECLVDEDCVCYPAFIDCGGVRDQATAQRLVEMDERRLAAGCDYIDLEGNAFNCAPWECAPRCSDGMCLQN